ncbi:MAG: hypothetical protein RLZZ29_2041, partial [Cyanobacteriota bacterium]
MKKQDIVLSDGLLLTFLVSVLFPSKVLATEQEKTNDFFNVNTNDQDIQPEKHLESTEVSVQSQNLTPSTPDVITTTPFSPKQKLNDTEEVDVQSQNLTPSTPDVITTTPFSPKQKLNDTE